MTRLTRPSRRWSRFLAIQSRRSLGGDPAHPISSGFLRKPKRLVKIFNPLARPDGQIFAALMNGEHSLHGLTDCDLGEKLTVPVLRRHDDPKIRSAKVGRILHRLHADGLVAKILRSSCGDRRR